MSDAQLTCRELVELVTDYLEGVLGQPRAGMVTEHLAHCEWCAIYVGQINFTLAALGALPPEPAPDALHLAIGAALTSDGASNGRADRVPSSRRGIDSDAS